MPYDIVDAFLENEKCLPPRFGAQRGLSGILRSRKLNLDPAGSQQIAGEPAHAVSQIAQIIALWIDGPNDVAHGIHQLPGEFRNARQTRVGWRPVSSRI